jgi:ABC-type Mn2+/Zn2+ transport system ATPase subunit
LKDLTICYSSGVALENISCVIQRGERIAVVGPNGAGKSTLFKVIAGLEPAQRGRLHFPDSAGAAPGAVAYIPQRNQVDWRFPVSVFDVVMMGRTGRIGLFRRPDAHDRAQVLAALEVVKMGQFTRRQISELSGGQQQRVFIARALAQEATLLLMDEPLTGLDLRSQDDIFNILADLRHQRVTVLTALHDLQLAARHFDRVMLLNRTMIGLGTPSEVFTPAQLMRAYGGHLHLIMTDEGILTVADTCCDHDEVISNA